jgi:taurine transport system permease protein
MSELVMATERRHVIRGIRLSGPVGHVATVVLSASVAILLWAGLARVIDDPLVLPGPWAVATRLGDLLKPSGQSLWPDIRSSLTRVGLGWAFGVVGGVLLGVVLSSSRYLNLAIDPALQAGRSIPPLAYSPLLVVWMGIGESSKVVLIVLTVLPIMAITTTAAISGIDQSLIRAAQTLGASAPLMLRRVAVPAVLPEIITSMRVTYGLAWGSLIAAEIIASSDGLGYRILQAGRYLDTVTVFVGIVAIAALAVLGDVVLRLVYRVAVPWKGRA